MALSTDDLEHNGPVCDSAQEGTGVFRERVQC
jgi:hypothetical protein